MALHETNQKLLKETEELEKLEIKKAKIDEKITAVKKKIEDLENRKAVEEYARFKDTLINAGISESEIFEAISKRDFSSLNEKVTNL